jgi:hypothetical protein
MQVGRGGAGGETENLWPPVDGLWPGRSAPGRRRPRYSAARRGRRKARPGEDEGPGLDHPGLRGGRVDSRCRVEACGGWPHASSCSEQERRVDGRFGRCRGCRRVLVLCGPCASVGASCVGCADERQRESHRLRNAVWARTSAGMASNRRRHVDWRARRALNKSHVTDTISTEGPAAPTPPSPSSSAVEPTRDTEVSTHEASDREENRQPAAGQAVRCARCGRVLSGRVRPSEWIPPQRRGRERTARQPRARGS